jgi:hypothetical protein
LPDKITIRTLGAFSVSVGGITVSDDSSLSYKVWMLFKYLVTNRGKAASTETKRS